MLAAYGNCIDVTELFMKCTTTVLHSKIGAVGVKGMATIQWGAGAVARKSTQNGKITQPTAGGRNLGRGEPDSEKAARYGDHHRPAAVADEPYIYLEKLQRSAGAHGT
ncbi:hypothetical protein KAM260_52930 (plasmid) [Klebsiella pneumoniae]|nr:hypothetical protein KAM260_52930 [Klebsiella pneumoniae]